jgi:hypothetical protein
MFDDHAGRSTEGFHAFECGIGVGDIVVGQFLSLQLHSGTDARIRWLLLHIESSLLMRVLAIAHVLALDELGRESARKTRRKRFLC